MMDECAKGNGRNGLRTAQILLFGALFCVSCGGGESGESSDSGAGGAGSQASSGANSCDLPTVSGELVTDVGAIQFPDTLAAGMVTNKDGLTALTVQAYFQEASQCFIMVSSVYGDFPTESLPVDRMELRGLNCENVDPKLNAIFQLASDFPASKLTIDLKQNTDYEDLFGADGECWTGTVQVTFSDFVDRAGLSEGEGLNLSGTMTFSGSFMRLKNH